MTSSYGRSMRVTHRTGLWKVEKLPSGGRGARRSAMKVTGIKASFPLSLDWSMCSGGSEPPCHVLPTAT